MFFKNIQILNRIIKLKSYLINYLVLKIYIDIHITIINM